MPTMKNLTLILFFVVIVFTATKAQHIFNYLYGNTIYENYLESIHRIENDFLLLGTEDNFDPNGGGHPIEGFSTRGFTVQLLDSRGTQRWKFFHENDHISGESYRPVSQIISLPNGNLVIPYIEKIGFRSCYPDTLSASMSFKGGILCLNITGQFVYDSVFSIPTCTSIRYVEGLLLKDTILLVYQKSNSVEFHKMDYAGNSLDILYKQYNYEAIGIESIDSNRFLIAGYDKLNGDISISLVDNYFDIIWIKTILSNNIYRDHVEILKTRDDNYLLFTGNVLTKISKKAEKLWSTHFQYATSAIDTMSDGKIILAFNIKEDAGENQIKYVIVNNSDGSILEEFLSADVNYHINTLLYNDGYYLLGGDTSSFYTEPGVASKILVKNVSFLKTGINNFKKIKKRININPTFSDAISINNLFEETFLLEIYDLQGKRVKKITLTKGTIVVPMNDLNSGMYVFSFFDKEHSLIQVSKSIKIGEKQ